MDLDGALASLEPSTPADPLDAALSSIDDDQRQNLAAARIETRTATPDAYGEAMRLGKQTGVPTQVAVKNLDTVRQDAEQQDFDRIVSASPTLGRWLQKPENMGVGRDDLQGLSAVEKQLQLQNEAYMRDTTFGERLAARFREGVLGLKQAMETIPRIGAIERGAQASQGDVTLGLDPTGMPITLAQVTPEGYLDSALQAYEETGHEAAADLGKAVAPLIAESRSLPQRPATTAMNNAQTLEEGFSAFMQDPFGVLADIGISSGVQQLPALALTVATRNPGVAVATAGGNSYALELGSGIVDYVQKVSDGPVTAETIQKTLADPKVAADAIQYSQTRGAIVGAFDAFSGGLSSKSLLGRSAGRELASTFIAQPVVQAGLGAAGEAAAQKATTGEVQAGAVLAEAVGEFTSAPIEAATFAAERIAARRKVDEAKAKALFDKSVEVAASTADAAQLDALTKAGADLKTSDRSPEAVEEFVREAGQTGSVYVDAVEAREFFQSQGIDPAVAMAEMTGDPAQVTEALATGGDLIIPMERYIARVTKTSYAEGVQRLARLDPNRLSQADLESPDLQKQIQSIIDSQAPEVAQPDPVFDDVRQQLLAAGRSKAEADAGARIMSDAFERRAAKRGKGETAADLYKATGLQITSQNAEPEEGAKTLAQTATEVTSTPEFQNWFGDSKVVDESGKPILVYHGTSAQDFEAFNVGDRGAWFGEDPRTAGMYAIGNDTMIDGAKRGENPLPRVVPAYLSIKNPYVVTPEDWAQMRGDSASYQEKQRELTARVKAEGYDGINYGDGVWTVFRPEQVKSVFNRGGFDPNDARILYQSTKPPSPEFKAAVETLLAEKEGEAPAALYQVDVGPIDLMYGKPGDPAKQFSDGYGLAHILAKHPEIDPFALEQIIAESTVSRRKGNTIELETADHRAVIKLDWEGKAKRWLLTAFRPAPTSQRIDVAGGTASETNPSEEAGKDSVPPGTKALKQADGSGPRARIELRQGNARIVLSEKSDRSSFFHEAGHLFLEQMIEDAQVSEASARDLDTALEWFGSDVRTKDGPEAVKAAIQTEQHEQFARGFEAYLMTGKAPTSELKKLFAAFKRWFAQLYRDIKALNVTLSPEITGVMDRLLASEDAILEAAAAQNYAMSLPVDEMRRLGISEEKLVSYARSIEAAQDELGTKLMEDYQRRAVGQEYRDTLKANAQAVDEETRKAKFWNDVEMLSKGKRLDDQPVPEGMVGVKVNTADAPPEILPTLKARGVVKATGQAADYVATLLDYPSGQVMLETIAKSPTRKQFIAQEAKRRTDAEFPDAMTDGTLENRALEALHNARMHAALQTELNLLGELARSPVPPARVIREAAARIVSSKTPAQNRPFQYLTQERKAARKAQIAAAAGKYAEALTHKREQALNAALYSEALQAQKDVEKLDKLMRRLDKKSTRATVAAGGQDFLTQLDQIRHVYSYTEVSPVALEAWAPMRSFLDQLQAEGEITSVSDRVLANVDRQRVQESEKVKVGELREVYEASRNLMHLASQANKIRKGEELVNREEAITEMLAAAEASGLKIKTLPRSQRELSTGDKAKNTVADMAMDLLRPENIFEAMDGGESGPWHDYWFSALDRSEKAMSDLRRRVATSLKALRKATPKGFLESLDKNVTVAPGVTMRRSTLLAAVLNSGNVGNIQRLASGGLLDDAGKPVNLTPAQVQGMRDLLTDAELAYVQGLWDTVNSLWPDIVELQRRVSGVPVEKVAPASFTVRGKEYRGGYWPLVYDSQRSNVGEVQTDADALRILMGQGFTRAATPKGYQKSRAEEFSAPLLLDFGAVMSRHLDHVMTDLSYRETVKHVSSLLRSNRIKQALLDRVGQSGLDSLKGQLAYSVSASSEVAGQVARGWRRFMDTMLSNMSVSALAIRPDIALGNYASALIQGMDRTGLKGLMRGLWQSYASRSDTSALIRSKSKFMAERLDEVDHWYTQELKWTAGKSGFGPAYRRLMMTLHRAASFEVERAVWVGRYLNERAAGKDDKEAVQLADKTIRQTQTANGRKDLSTFERDTSFRQTRQFMGPMFVIFGRLNEAAKGQGNSRQVGERIARILLQVFLAPAIFALAAGRWPEDDDDEEGIGPGEWALWTAVNTLLFPIQTLPILREAGSAAEALMTNKPVNPRGAPTSQAVANMAKAGRGIARKIDEYQDTDELDYFGLTRDLLALVGPLTGLPTSQIRITTKGIEAALDDGEDDRNLASLLLYGPPK